MSDDGSGAAQSTPNAATAPKDLVAGLINAVVSLPDGLAAGALAGVNPIYGLYASMAGPLGGGFLVSAQLMQIATTSASALAAAQALGGLSGEARDQTLFLLVILIGLWLILFGLLRLGQLTRYISHSVMIGFLAGVAALLVLDQLAPFVGYTPQGSNELLQVLDLLRNVNRFNPGSIVVGTLALLIAIGLNRTPLALVSSIVALVVPSLLVALFGWDNVPLVQDVSPIPQGLPLPALPALSLLSPGLAGSALAIAIIIMVQGAGVSQSVRNPDGTRPDTSHDFIAQGVGNLLSGLFRGLPVGGSVGQTALNVSVGAQSRWSMIFGGIWMAVILLLIPGLVGRAPMAVLAALMILAGFSALNVDEAVSVWKTSFSARLSILGTFLATLVLPIQWAVAAGVVLTVVLFLMSSSDVTLVEIVPVGDGQYEERSPPERLPSDSVTILDVHGSLFFAGARTLEERLPAPEGAHHPAVLLRLRGRTSVGATFVDVLDDYAERLEAVGGRLYLSGVDEQVGEQLRRAGKFRLGAHVVVYPEEKIIGRSSRGAYEDARAWLSGHHSERATDGQRREERESGER